MIFKFRTYTKDETEYFTYTTFNKEIGKDISITKDVKATLLSVEISANGRWADLTLEVSDDDSEIAKKLKDLSYYKHIS